MNFKEELLAQGLEVPYDHETACLAEPLVLYGKKVPNRIGILPLEGFDSEIDGSPSEYVFRRYLRFVRGGAGLIWFEACAVNDEAKSNPGQMMLRDSNVDSFRKLLHAMDDAAAEQDREPAFKVLQLTHSGRTSKDEQWNPIPLSPKSRGDEDTARIATDEEIAKIVEDHIHAAELAAQAGFDAVDIKVCHGYFLSEMLSAFDREGRYGGSFENRTRALFEIVDGIRQQVGSRIGITVRLNAHDSKPFPYGYGVVEENGVARPDLTETIRICEMLKERGVELINISASSPRVRLFGPTPEDPAYRKYDASVDYLLAIRQLRENVKDLRFMCTGLSVFGAEGGFIAAGGIRGGWFDIAGFGRQALAYPDFASDLLAKGTMDKDRCCAGCDACLRMMDPGHCRVGCIVRDREEFYPIYRSHVLERQK